MNVPLSNSNNASSSLGNQPSAATGNKCPTSASTSSSLKSQACSNKYRYIYDLPYNARKPLTDLLDADGSWRQLGGEYLELTDVQLTLISHALLRGTSPTNEILGKLEQTNTKTSTLFRYLAAMRHFRALDILGPYVDPQLVAACEQQLSSSSTTDELLAIKALSVHEPELSHVIPEENSKQSPATSNDLKNNNQNQHGYYNYKQPLVVANCECSTSSSCSAKVINKVPSAWNNFGPNQAKLSPTPPENDRQASIMSTRQSVALSQMDDDLEVLYKELLIATDDFCQDRVIGSGGFGVVYRGEWKGTQVAIKRLKGGDNVAQAITELKVLNRYRIDNILPLYGISLDGPEACVLYQYMPNGSLEDKLLDKGKTGQVLGWQQRINIAEGVARALNYLHTLKGRPLVHGDVKSANVLLDAQFEPKLGDFGLSRPLTSQDESKRNAVYTHVVVTSVHGTSVYLPPEYLRHKILSPAVDTYSYGIVMLEMATGRRAFDGKRLLIDLVEDEVKAGHSDVIREGGIRLRDPKLTGDDSDGRVWFSSLIKLGTDCAHRIKKKRPDMAQVLDYFGQCRTRERIRRLSMESARSDGSNASTLPNNELIRTPMEIQLWYDMMRQGAGLAAPDSTICPTIGSVSTASDETTITLNVPDLRRNNNHTNSTNTTTSAVPSGITAMTGLSTNPGQQEDVADLTQLSNDTDEEDEAVIPLITELGIGAASETQDQLLNETQAEILNNVSEAIDSVMMSGTSAFSRTSTPPSE